jgi:hypothetical protein
MRHLDDVTSADTGRRRTEIISSVKSPFAKPQTLPARSRQRCTAGVSLLVANVAGLNLVRDVLVGVLFALWTAWWISVL